MALNKATKKFVNGLLHLCLLISIAGCSTLAPILVQQTQKLKTPGALLTKCAVPQLEGQTNGDLYVYAKDLSESLTACNKRLDDIKQWNDEAPVVEQPITPEKK